MAKKILWVMGIALSGTAIFANQLGLDNNESWGGGRTLLLRLGIVLILMGVLFHFFYTKAADFYNRAEAKIHNTIDRPRRITITSTLTVLFVFFTYIWFMQPGQRVVGTDYEYYIALAKSFKEGRLYLNVEPSPELLGLENPYNYRERQEKGVDNFPWDLSLYADKFYVYWGPIPALLITILSDQLLSKMGDFHLALFFACGIAAYTTMFLSIYWNKSLIKAPARVLGYLLLTICLATPVAILLKGARIYEAAIFGSQCFFIGGIFWAYAALQNDIPSNWKLSLASIHWSLAVGTRVLILPAVLFCIIITLITLIQIYKKQHGKLPAAIILALIMPLAAIGCSIAWYNYARFDSIFEFGLKYQLATIDYTQASNIFSFSRIPDNLKLYFTHPLKITTRFPFISRIEYPNSNDRLGGILYITPYIILLLLPAFSILKKTFQRQNSLIQEVKIKELDSWTQQILMGAGLITALILMSYYFVAMRFIEDFLPPLLILTTFYIGHLYESYPQKENIRKGLLAATFLLALVTLVTNTLLAIPISGTEFMLNFINSAQKLLGLR